MRVILLLLTFVVCINGIALGQMRHTVAEDSEDLDNLGIQPTSEGIGKYLDALARGPNKPLTDAEADALIAKLGNDAFEVREAATKQLLGLGQPPLERLKAAQANPDLEIRTRVEGILAKLASRSDPLAATLRVARTQKLRLPNDKLIALLEKSKSASVAEAARNLLVAQARAEDLPLAKKWAESDTASIKEAGLRVWAVLEKEKAIPVLRGLLTHDKPEYRMAAARGLLDADVEVDALAASKDGAPEAAVFLLQIAEWKMRNALKDSRKDEKAMAGYHKLAIGYSEVLSKIDGVRVERGAARNTQYYLQQGLDTSKHPEILLYKIQWFASNWSAWYSPGFNDAEDSNRKIRHWACFNDHNHEVIVTTRRDLFRQILDLEKP